jgi:hypothetical protein
MPLPLQSWSTTQPRLRERTGQEGKPDTLGKPDQPATRLQYPALKTRIRGGINGHDNELWNCVDKNLTIRL